MARLGLLGWPAGVGVAFGLGAEYVGFGWKDPLHWVPDLAVGWTFIASGFAVSARRPDTRAGALLAATGFAWFAGNLASAGWAPLAWIAAQATYLHRGVLVHTLLAYPTGRLSSRLDRAVVVGSYAVSVMPAVAADDAATAVLGAVVGVSCAHGYLATRGRARRARLPAVRAAALAGGVLVVGAAVRVALPAGDANEAILLAYEAALCSVAIMLTGGLLRRPEEDAAVADLVVELGEQRSGTLRDGLARALGEPTLEVGHWSPRAGGYVDASGRPFVVPEPGAERAVTLIERGEERVAALVHDPAVLDDPALVEGVSVAARLAAVNVRLRAEVHAQLAELHSSRRRLVEAGDEERRGLERRLREGAERRLLDLSATLARAEPSAGSETAERLARAEGQLARTLHELHELARGLHPRVLSEQGLAGAIEALAAAGAVPADVSVSAQELAREVEVALYFVCAEALANAAKHASASRVSVVITRDDGRISARIADDGVGGADLLGGSGLRGVVDRVEALGGTLRLDSPPGRGTRIAADIPLGGAA